jgi:hypothetical protein
MKGGELKNRVECRESEAAALVLCSSPAEFAPVNPPIVAHPSPVPIPVPASGTDL